MSKKYNLKEELKKRNIPYDYYIKHRNEAFLLERDFSLYRIFGDERDLQLYEFKHDIANGNKLVCPIPLRDPSFHEDVNIDGLRLICADCIRNMIQIFKEYRKKHNLPKDNFGLWEEKGELQEIKSS